MAKPTADQAWRELAQRLKRRGYFRSPPEKKDKDTHRGYECRFMVEDAHERDAILALLKAAGVAAGRPFAHGKGWRIPIYGRETIEKLHRLVNRS